MAGLLTLNLFGAWASFARADARGIASRRRDFLQGHSRLTTKSLVREGTLARKRAEEAMEDLIAVRVTRYAPVVLLHRIWQLRQNLSAYDAAYVALAEELKAPLITRDQKIAAAPGHSATIEVF